MQTGGGWGGIAAYQDKTERYWLVLRRNTASVCSAAKCNGVRDMEGEGEGGPPATVTAQGETARQSKNNYCENTSKKHKPEPLHKIDQSNSPISRLLFPPFIALPVLQLENR